MLGRIYLDPNVPPGRTFYGWERLPFGAAVWSLTVHPDTLHSQLSELPSWIKTAQTLAESNALGKAA